MSTIAEAIAEAIADAPVFFVVIAALVGLIFGAVLGMWIADREWTERRREHAPDWHSRIAGPGLPTEEDEAATEEDLRIRRWL
jgi:glycerol uptake facilitator-like aquaporin